MGLGQKGSLVKFTIILEDEDKDFEVIADEI
jgi:hypothetical protein